MTHTYSEITNIDEEVVTCDDCGGTGASEDRVYHRPGCIPGGLQSWGRQQQEWAEKAEMVKSDLFGDEGK